LCAGTPPRAEGAAVPAGRVPADWSEGTPNASRVRVNRILPLLRAIERVNERTGKVLALITPLVIAITVLEVTLRYVFNSPTNWAHEASTLLFGMQYILSGAYAHYHGQHVNVDVLSYTWPARRRAWVDVLSSAFFFLFVAMLTYTSWFFFLDSWEMREVSFTDWAPPYYPVKLTIPVAFFLLGLQGIVKLVRDLHLALTGKVLA
jgi:TRAP-type mannitol/chloroaromatic compound transport system permease small subunit